VTPSTITHRAKVLAHYNTVARLRQRLADVQRHCPGEHDTAATLREAIAIRSARGAE
jgi:hypothetical protein